jgi:hypothetical protein
MNELNSLKTLQLFYAGLMVDAASNFEHFGVIEKVTAKKAQEQLLAAPAQLTQLCIRSSVELFERFSSIFGCAQWNVTDTGGGSVIAQTSTCLACAIAKKRGGGRPCDLYCINTFQALLASLSPAKRLVVEDTLWSWECCHFRIESNPA